MDRLTLGDYIIYTDGLKMDPDGKTRHMVVQALAPYWCKIEREALDRRIANQGARTQAK